MADTDHQPPELLKLGQHEYLVYEVADHTEHAPSAIGVRLERNGNSKFSVHCTGNFVDGKLANVQPEPIEQADSNQARMMIRILDHSPELQSFVRTWIEYCHRRREAAAKS